MTAKEHGFARHLGDTSLARKSKMRYLNSAARSNRHLPCMSIPDRIVHPFITLDI